MNDSYLSRPVKFAACLMGAMVIAAAGAKTYDIRDFGARESDLLQTPAIQKAIDTAAAAGGGEVLVPEGRFRTGGLVLKSGVTLHLANGAELLADRNPDNYPGKDRWYRALVRADGAHDIGIVGERYSCFNGANVYDPRGEVNYRGPHGIMLLGCTNVTLRGYTFRDCGNWGHALFHCANARISDVRVFGGHDAVDFHDSTDVTVEKCELRTGDDCIAGFANYRCTVRDCILDTSCQAVRIGGADILIDRCRIVHPASFGHRSTMPEALRRASAFSGEHARHGMSAGMLYYCDSRWEITRPQRNIVFRDCDFDHPNQIFRMNYDGRDMWCSRHPLESIAFERCTFRDVAYPSVIHGDAERPLAFAMRDCRLVAAKGRGDQPLLTAYNFKSIRLENVKLEGFRKPHLVTRSKGEVVVTGGTPVENRYAPDPNDVVLSFAESAAALAKEKSDEAAWRKWCAAHPTPPESRWNAEKGLYVTERDPLLIDVYASALAVLRGETKHAMEISRALCTQYQYFVGWRRTGEVKPALDGPLSSMPAGAFGYAMSLFDPLFAKTFFTDFVRSSRRTPAAVAGAREALAKLTASARPRRTVAFLGGSITEMDGFRPRVMKQLREKYPDVEFAEIASGLASTCSDAGAFRLEEDVLAKASPDLFIVEAAVNDDQDGGFSAEHSVRGMEGAVRHVLTRFPKCAVVVGLMVNHGQYVSLTNGVTPLHYAAHARVAAHYGAALADVGSALAAETKRGGLGWGDYRDCHPSPVGCDLGAKVVMEAIGRVFDPKKERVAKPLPPPLDVHSYARGRALASSEVKLGTGWQMSLPDWKSIPGGKRGYFTRGPAIWSETAGSELAFSFVGDAAGIFLTAGNDAGNVEASVDGKPFELLRLRAMNGLHYPYVHMIADGLPEGRHTVRLRVAEAERNGRKCSAVRIHRIFVNGRVP